MEYKIVVPKELLGAHECETLLLTCMDFRFREATQKFVKEVLGLENFDGPISVPGVLRGVAEKNPVTTAFIKNVIDTGIKIHGTKKVIVVHHGNCGAYGIEDAEREIAVQREDAKKAYTMLGDMYPGISFEIYFARKGDGEIVYTKLI